jgi:transposase
MHRFIEKQPSENWREETEHQVLFLPKYSPDLNDIEHDFSALKRARMYAPPGTSLDELICTTALIVSLFYLK